MNTEVGSSLTYRAVPAPIHPKFHGQYEVRDNEESNAPVVEGNSVRLRPDTGDSERSKGGESDEASREHGGQWRRKENSVSELKYSGIREVAFITTSESILGDATQTEMPVL